VNDECLFKLTNGPGRVEPAGRHRSHTRVIAGLSGFFTLIHVRTRPEPATVVSRSCSLFHAIARRSLISNAAQLLLLVGGGVDFDGNVSDHPVRSFLCARRVEAAAERPAMTEAEAMPKAVTERRSEALAERTGRECTDAREA